MARVARTASRPKKGAGRKTPETGARSSVTGTSGGKKGGKRQVVILPSPDHLGLDPSSLVSYAVTGQVERMQARTWDRDVGWVPLASPTTRKALADGLGMTDSALSKQVNGPFEKGHAGAPRPRLERLKKRQESPLTTISTLEVDLAMFAVRERGVPVDALEASGSLVAFWQELLGDGETAAQPDLRAARWLDGLAESGPRNTAEALVAGEALLALLAHAASFNDAVLLLDRHRPAVTRVARALVTVASKPPARGSLPAIHLAAQLGALPVQWDDYGSSPSTVCDIVVEHAGKSPVGFRVIRVLSHILELSRPGSHRQPRWWSPDGAEERALAWRALLEIRERGYDTRDPYPARSLWVEGLRAMVLCDDPRYRDRATALLRGRVASPTRPPRERAYAAYCAYLAEPTADRTADLLADLEQETDDGLTHAALTLRTLLDDSDTTLGALLLERTSDAVAQARFLASPGVSRVDGYLFGNDVPDPGAQREIQKVLDDVPVAIRDATRQLLRFSLLSIDGTARRRAADTLREGGFGPEAATVFIAILEADDPEAPKYLREHAAFLLGFLNEREALIPLKDVGCDPEEDPTVRHAALWAIGDIACPSDETLEDISEVVRALDQQPIEVQRAATYALASLYPTCIDHLAADSAVVDPGTTTDVRSLLRHVARSAQDELVRQLANWGLTAGARLRIRLQQRSLCELWGIPRRLDETLNSAREADARAAPLG